MNNALPEVPTFVNEPVLSYAPGSVERDALRRALNELKTEEFEIPVIAGGRRLYTGRVETIHPPHELSRTLGRYHKAESEEVNAAIDAAVEARNTWGRMPWTERVAVFLKAADLLAGPYRGRLNAATMLGQSKSVFQAEIDSACELIDFFRFNARFLAQIYSDQPHSAPGMWNRMEYRPLEGFVFAVTPFNFTSIAGNLPTAPAIAGNGVVWKPASTAVLSGFIIYEILEEAGLPPGVINFVPGSGRHVGDPVFASPHLSGLHFTGSTGTFQHMWRTIGRNIDAYKTYPRIVGETGGKDFIVAHMSADPVAVATAIARGSFEYQGQKCSASSRMYIPRSLWPEVRRLLESQLGEMRMGPVEDFGNFMNAVIDRSAFETITGFIDRARAGGGVEFVWGGGYTDEPGFFIEPTVIRVDDPQHEIMREEIFGPVAAVFVYEDGHFDETLALVNRTSPYALTGSIFANDRSAVLKATEHLADAAGNFYINDKPTGAVVGQQPFGGARASGTNDKAGSYLNLIRWMSARSIKETFIPARHFAYPFLKTD